MGWCDDVKSKNNYNKLIKVNKKIRHEKLFRKDYRYDFVIPINYNTENIKIRKGSAIFIHLSKRFAYSWMCCSSKKRFFNFGKNYKQEY